MQVCIHAGQSRLDKWGDKYPGVEYALQGVALVAANSDKRREMPIFVWHNAVQGDRDSH